MTIEQIVQVFKAKRIGKGKWTAICPAHKDKSPSLSIREGNVAALINCWSNQCSMADICKAVGIQQSDLWYQSIEKDPRKREEAAKKAERQYRIDAAYERELRKYWREVINKGRMWQRVSWHLGELLPKNPDDARLVRLFHAALERSAHFQEMATKDDKSAPVFFDTCALGSIKNVKVADVGNTIYLYLLRENNL